MAATPKYNVDDVVYIRASAKIGFLESYRISGITQARKNKWSYQVKFVPYSGNTATLGDAITATGKLVVGEIYFAEEELLTLCEALDLQIENLNRRLAAAIAMRTSQCS